MDVVDESQVEQPSRYTEEQIENRAIVILAMSYDAVREKIDGKGFYANQHSVTIELEDELDFKAAGWLMNRGKDVTVNVIGNTLIVHHTICKVDELIMSGANW